MRHASSLENDADRQQCRGAAARHRPTCMHSQAFACTNGMSYVIHHTSHIIRTILAISRAAAGGQAREYSKPFLPSNQSRSIGRTAVLKVAKQTTVRVEAGGIWNPITNGHCKVIKLLLWGYYSTTIWPLWGYCYVSTNRNTNMWYCNMLQRTRVKHDSWRRDSRTCTGEYWHSVLYLRPHLSAHTKW